MSEIEVEVRPYAIKYLCDACGEGYMERNIELGDIAYMTNPPKWKHKCGACGHTELLTKAYPEIRFEYAEEETNA